MNAAVEIWKDTGTNTGLPTLFGGAVARKGKRLMGQTMFLADGTR